MSSGNEHRNFQKKYSWDVLRNIIHLVALMIASLLQEMAILVVLLWKRWNVVKW